MQDNSNAIQQLSSRPEHDNHNKHHNDIEHPAVVISSKPKRRPKKRPLCVTDQNPATVSSATITQLPNGTLLRTLEPYLYTFTSFARGRWVGRTVLDVYSDEFDSYPASYYRAAIEQGRIQVGGQRVSIDYRIVDRDELSHTVHRHEPAVLIGQDEAPFFTIVAETEEIVAVDKPAAIPVHACGGYHRNALMTILENETKYGKLCTIHRLDRLTSGLVVLAKSSQVAKKWGKAITDRTCEKIYLARVKGRFGMNIPNNLPLVHGSVYPVSGEWPCSKEDKFNTSTESLRKRCAYGYWVTDGQGEVCTDDHSWAVEHSVEELLLSLDGKENSKCIRWLHLACPVRLEKPKDGVCSSGPFPELDDTLYVKTVKPSQTSFAIVRYFKDSTLILARPFTGRTHQIRLHLHHLGHSIANDPNYGGDTWFGDKEGKVVSERVQEALGEESVLPSSTPATEAEVCNSTSLIIQPPIDQSLEETVQRSCVWCSRLGSQSARQRALQEFQLRSQGLWLHALRYRISKEAVFQTNAPKWAVEDS